MNEIIIRFVAFVIVLVIFLIVGYIGAKAYNIGLNKTEGYKTLHAIVFLVLSVINFAIGLFFGIIITGLLYAKAYEVPIVAPFIVATIFLILVWLDHFDSTDCSTSVQEEPQNRCKCWSEGTHTEQVCSVCGRQLDAFMNV